MVEWSGHVSDNFRVQFTFDTNILAFLVDECYPSLNKFVKLLQDSPFAQQASSNYALYEYRGIRKKEHFLRLMVRKNLARGTRINVSSLLKYEDEYEYKDLVFLTMKEDISREVEREIQYLADEYSIVVSHEHYLYSNRDLMSIAKDLHFASLISKEDCLVVLSSVLSHPLDTICILTNDDNLGKHFNKREYSQGIEQIFLANTLKKPFVERIVALNGCNLTKHDVADDKIENAAIGLISKVVIERNKSLYIGKTYDANVENTNVICFKSDIGSILNIPQNPYLTIIGKDLDFIYHLPGPVKEFRDKQRNIFQNVPIQIDSIGGKLSFAWVSMEADHPNKIYEENIVAKIREPDNLVFLHPDSIT